MPEVGTIKFFDARRGFGFIAHAAGDVFVHAKHIAQYGLNDRQLEPGTPVRFAFMKDAKRGPAADAICLMQA